MILFDLAARLLLSPLLLVQVLIIRRRAIQLPEADGPRSGVDGDGPALRLLILGDSSAAGVGVDTQSQALQGQLVERLADRHRVSWDLIARTGATTADTLVRLDEAPKQDYDVVVIGLGVNDVKNGVTLRRWLVRQERLLDRLTHEFSASRIVVSGLPPMHRFPLLPQPMRWLLARQAQRFDRHLRAVVAGRPNCAWVQMVFTVDERYMARDGFHPGPKIYEEWATLVADKVVGDRPQLDPQEVSA